jgi:hypothetical protein
MCFVKYPHKKKKLNAAWAAKKKGKLSSLSSDKFLSKFFNNVKSTFNKTDDNVTTLSFMITPYECVNCWYWSLWSLVFYTHSFIYEPISRSFKTANEPAQIIEKSMISLCLIHSDSDIQEVILKDVMHASDSSANLVLIAACASMISFDMCDCIIHHKTTTSLNTLLRSTEFFSYTLTIHLSLMPLQLIVSSRYHLICDIDAWAI